MLFTVYNLHYDCTIPPSLLPRAPEACPCVGGKGMEDGILTMFFLSTHVRPAARGGVRGGSDKPPCSLATFIYNKTAAVVHTGYNRSNVQWYCYRRHTSHHAAATRGSRIHVACRSVCDWDKEFWSVLDRLITLRKRCNYDVIIDHTPHE